MSDRRTTRPIGRWGTVSPPPVEPVEGQLALAELADEHRASNAAAAHEASGGQYGQPATPSRGRSS